MEVAVETRQFCAQTLSFKSMVINILHSFYIASFVSAFHWFIRQRLAQSSLPSIRNHQNLCEHAIPVQTYYYTVMHSCFCSTCEV
jgi:hypothetical protein